MTSLFVNRKFIRVPVSSWHLWSWFSTVLYVLHVRPAKEGFAIFAKASFIVSGNSRLPKLVAVYIPLLLYLLPLFTVSFVRTAPVTELRFKKKKIHIERFPCLIAVRKFFLSGTALHRKTCEG